MDLDGSCIGLDVLYHLRGGGWGFFRNVSRISWFFICRFFCRDCRCGLLLFLLLGRLRLLTELGLDPG
jgi:hypothetical protein